MENRPVITISAESPAPGADVEVYERFLNWNLEVYGPLTLKIPEALGLDFYKIVKENPEYPFVVRLIHYKNIRDWSAYTPSSIGAEVQKDLRSWEERGIVEFIWHPAYALLRSFRSKLSSSSSNENTMIENAPIMYLEAFRLSQEEQEKYYKWSLLQKGDVGVDLLAVGRYDDFL